MQSAGDRNLGEYVCYVGAPNTTRTCGHKIAVQNVLSEMDYGENAGNLTLMTIAQNIVVDGSSGGAVSYSHEAIGIISGVAISSVPQNGYAAGTLFNVYTPVDEINALTSTHQVCTTANQYCYGAAG